MHAVIFDIDGTLLQSADVDEELYKLAVESVLGPVRFREALTDYDRVTDAGILAQVFADNSIPASPDLALKIRASFVAAIRSHIDAHGPFPEVPGAKNFLQALRTSEAHAVAIATGSWRDTAHLKLRSAEFDIDGVPVATADDALDRHEIMLAALARIGEDFESISYYGDGPWDRLASERLGWRFVPVGPALGGLTSFREARPL